MLKTKLVSLMVGLASLSFPASASTESLLAEAMELAILQMRPTLPKRVDNVTTLFGVAYSKHTNIFEYNYEVLFTKQQLLAMTDSVLTIAYGGVCTSPDVRGLVDMGLTIKNSYYEAYTKQHVMSVHIDKNVCARRNLNPGPQF